MSSIEQQIENLATQQGEMQGNITANSTAVTTNSTAIAELETAQQVMADTLYAALADILELVSGGAE